MSSQYIPKALRSVQIPKRKSAKQQVREERQRLIAGARTAMLSHKRNIPKEWHKGFMSAVSAFEIWANEQ